MGLARLVEKKQLKTPVTYYALDLEKRELERTLNDIENSGVGKQLTGKVAMKGMWGTYDDGLKFIEDGGLARRRSAQGRFSCLSADGVPVEVESCGDSLESGIGKPPAWSSTLATKSSPPSSMEEEERERIHIMFLGSSLGNFEQGHAVTFLRDLPLRAGSGDSLLLGLDHDNAKEKIEEAYDDPKGYSRRFAMNILLNAGRVLGDERLFDKEKWEYVSSYNSVSRLIGYFRQIF
jgi:L-histidine Nalpha-methyltransferase / hercynylcysteine S-oxide synthase